MFVGVFVVDFASLYAILTLELSTPVLTSAHLPIWECILVVTVCKPLHALYLRYILP
jgi:hypothetical protein